MQTADPISTRYDEVSPSYDPGTTENPLLRLLWWVYEDLTWSPVEALLPKDKSWRILDAGGGGGKYGTRMAALGHHVTVLDISAGMVEQARSRFAEAGLSGRSSFQVGNILELPFPEASFDLVFCEGDPVSYCLEQYPRAVAELFRVVVPGGAVVMGVDSRMEAFRGEFLYGDKSKALSVLRTGRTTCPYGLPVHAFTEAELRAAVEAAGGEVVEIFGKPILFIEILQAFQAERGPDFDPWEARQEFLELQRQLAHSGQASDGGHLQVMARRRR